MPDLPTPHHSELEPQGAHSIESDVVRTPEELASDEVKKASEALNDIVEGLDPTEADEAVSSLVEDAAEAYREGRVTLEATETPLLVGLLEVDQGGVFTKAEINETPPTLLAEPLHTLELFAGTPIVKEILNKLDDRSDDEPSLDMVHDSQAHVEQGERAAESPASVTAAATLLEMTSTKPEGGIRLAKLEHQVDEPEQILNNLPTKVELTFEQRSRLSEQNLRFINSRNLIMAAPVQAGSQGAEAFDKTQRDRGMFERGIGAASHESYCSQLFASASNPEITKFVAESLDGKTIVNLGGGNAKIAHELRESHGVQVDMKNIEPYASERALQDPDSDPIISANPAEANFFETSGLDQHSQDEVWAEYSVPAYLGTAEEITNLFDNIQKLLKPEGIARIGHCGLVTGENNEGRRQALIDSLKAAADKGYLIEAVDVNSKLTLLMTAPLDVAR